MEEHFKNNPELLRLVLKGDKNELVKYLTNHQNLASQMLNDMAGQKEPAEKIKLAVIDKMFDEQDYLGAIELIEKGLQLHDTINERYLFSLRSECNVKLKNYNEALQDINKAIESITKYDPEDLYQRCEFFKKRLEIRTILNDDYEYRKDRAIIRSIEEELKKSHTSQDDAYDLPF